MRYLNRLKSSLYFKNFRKGFDETTLYGPLCLILAIALIILFSLKLINPESMILAGAVLAYIFFFYFPFHKSNIILAGYFIILIPLFIIGIASIISGKVSFEEIKALSITWWIYYVITLILIVFSSIRRSLKEADRWSTLSHKMGGKWLVLFFLLIAPLAFFLVAGTYRLFGQNHTIAWIIVYCFWAISDIRLLIYKIIKKSGSHTA